MSAVSLVIRASEPPGPDRVKNINIYDYSMSVMEEISKLSKDGCDDALLNYICDNYDEIECELNGDEYKEPKKNNRNFCTDCNLEMIIDYQKSTLFCRNCGLCEYYPVYM